MNDPKNIFDGFFSVCSRAVARESALSSGNLTLSDLDSLMGREAFKNMTYERGEFLTYFTQAYKNSSNRYFLKEL